MREYLMRDKKKQAGFALLKLAGTVYELKITWEAAGGTSHTVALHLLSGRSVTADSRCCAAVSWAYFL